MPYSEESECSEEEPEHRETDRRGDDDGYRGSGPNGNDANDLGGAGWGCTSCACVVPKVGVKKRLASAFSTHDIICPNGSRTTYAGRAILRAFCRSTSEI